MACCHRDCKECGTRKQGCANDPLGASHCCLDAIAERARSCNTHQAPCMLDVERFSKVTTLADPYSENRNTVVGVLTGPKKTVEEREKKYGIKFDAELMYMNVLVSAAAFHCLDVWPLMPPPLAPALDHVQNLDFSSVRKVLKKGRNVQLVIEVFDNLKGIASGKYDGYLVKFGDRVRKFGEQITVRLLHEINGTQSSQHAWGWFCRVDAMPPSIHATMAYNAQNASGHDTPLEDFYTPIEDYVDEICVSAYNLCGDAYPENKPLTEILGAWYKQVTWFSSKHLCISEMSSTGHCTGKPEWIKQTWETLATDYTQFTAINWFLENKVETLNRDWDLNSKKDIREFTSGFRKFKEQTAVH
ncbi:hypothetical protein JKP88DRAFT_249748 [Tribonema minus]|uniref:Uncharacterized protein n=1 Tax=Tribonema minus TaxID=303371 RepID=A0A836C810_9STRA|nr:hypothetical protein JKP88DRAFT_249748 [Tribonema minus]